MSVEVKINGQVIHTIAVTNRGPVGEYEDGDYPGGGGLRQYEWVVDGHTKGKVEHFRDDGALCLAALVCEEAIGCVARPDYEVRQ